MSPYWIKLIEASEFPALIVSFCFNVVLCTAVVALWRSKEKLVDKVTGMLVELCNELNRRFWARGE